jgi:hypothetical protein
LFAILFSINFDISAFCKKGLNQLQIPYLRASHRFDYVCLFLALWMDLLGLVNLTAAVTRTISFCLDEMFGNVFRIYILGRNSSMSEPWPDVLSVLIVLITSGMFILGNGKLYYKYNHAIIHTN